MKNGGKTKSVAFLILLAEQNDFKSIQTPLQQGMKGDENTYTLSLTIPIERGQPTSHPCCGCLSELSRSE